MGKCCCFTGHRRIPERETALLRARLDKFLPQLFEMGYDTFLAGGVLGFDTMAELAVIRLQHRLPVELHLILPCPQQAEHWSRADRSMYDDILLMADRVTYAAEQYERGCMHKRNRMLVEESSACVCYFAHSGGGTGYTVKYAREKGLRIFNLAR